MDNLDRMLRHLVRTVRTKHPQYLTQPFTVAELHQSILPYRIHRRELGLETNEDYEITLTELLSGARDYLIVDDAMRERLRGELASKNPDPTAFKQFANSTVAISPSALRSLEVGPDEGVTPPGLDVFQTPATTAESPVPAAASAKAATAAAPTSAPRQAAPAPPPPAAQPTPSRLATSPSPIGSRAVVPNAGERCRYCNELLPPGRTITFCPHCGQNLTVVNCEACGTELEVGWKFCPVCGRPAATH